MIRLAIIDSDGKTRLPKDFATAAELVAVVEQARILIRECERLSEQKNPKRHAPGSGQVPYTS